MQLRRRKRTMQHRCHQFECQLPSAPQTAEEVKDDDGFADSAEEGGHTSEEEEAAEEEMAGGIDPVEDYSNVREEFADNIEGTCTSKVSNPYIPVERL